MSLTYLTADGSSKRIHNDQRTIRERMSDSAFIEGTNKKINLIQEATKALEIRTRNRRIAEHLMTFFMIGADRKVAQLLGYGMEKNNLEALINWVTINIEDHEELNYSEQLDAMAKQLLKELDTTVYRIMMSEICG